LPGSEISAAAGGGRVIKPRGLIHCGDIIDTGDKNGGPHLQMQQTEFARFVEDYGLTGSDGKLPYPVYELHGNHDAPRGTGHAVEQIAERNRSRPGVVGTSDNGVHYSWDWGPLHCVCLGLTVGVGSGLTERRGYDPLGSADFLAADLDKHVGRSNRPVVIAHHLDLPRYCVPCNPGDAAKKSDWNACDVAAFYDAIQGYNVAAVFYGHTHARSTHHWDGRSAKVDDGIALFNVDDASHFDGKAQGLFYVELTEGGLTIREYATRDNWRTAAWTPQTWNVALPAKA
jgi:cytolysin (calcineurin-like family phosphatase)